MRPLALLLAVVLLAACGVVRPPSRNAQADDFQDDLAAARSLTEEFWKQQFQAMGRTYRPVRGFIGYSGGDGPSCAGQRAVPNNAFYCPYGHFIAYDRDWLEALWNELGDGSTFVIIPHEFGHAVQAQLETSFSYNIEIELQADCYAGGTLSGLVQAGALRAEPGDDDELMISLAAAGDPEEDWFDPQAHGTAEQRQQAFARGYRQGVGAC
ncbi:neutral zinc metallopeptidase [Thermoactinospora rubra]|uniref:neutral zinc metallopeptidase n=1 Tax=Thermoactinospora rubra TaxID=1088767 RepID=UPI000A1003D7|nr:neutral zinc metallopeptidase [Thermoactinospora rubra]